MENKTDNIKARRKGRPPLNKEASSEDLAQSEPTRAIRSNRPISFQRPDLLRVLRKNNKYKYRWVNFNKMKSNGGTHHNGWRLLTSLTKTDEIILKEHGYEVTELTDGCIRRAELALAYMPIEQWKELKASIDYENRVQKEAVFKRKKDDEWHEYESSKR